MKWLIYKKGPRDWRASRGGAWEAKCSTHAAAVDYMNTVVAANRYAALAA